MITVKQDILFFKRDEELGGGDFEVSLIDAPEKFINKLIAHHLKTGGYKLLDHNENNINLPIKYNGYLWLLWGGIFGAITSAFGTAFLFSLH